MRRLVPFSVILRLITFISPLIKGRASSSSSTPPPPPPHVYLYSSHPLISCLYSAYPFSSRFLYLFQRLFYCISPLSSCYWYASLYVMEILLLFKLRARVCGMNVSEHCTPNMALALLESLWSKLWAQQAPAAAAIKSVRELCVCLCRKDEKRASLIPRSSLS